LYALPYFFFALYIYQYTHLFPPFFIIPCLFDGFGITVSDDIKVCHDLNERAKGWRGMVVKELFWHFIVLISVKDKEGAAGLH
jgi:hypothetical protein